MFYALFCDAAPTISRVSCSTSWIIFFLNLCLSYVVHHESWLMMTSIVVHCKYMQEKMVLNSADKNSVRKEFHHYILSKVLKLATILIASSVWILDTNLIFTYSLVALGLKFKLWIHKYMCKFRLQSNWNQELGLILKCTFNSCKLRLVSSPLHPALHFTFFKTHQPDRLILIINTDFPWSIRKSIIFGRIWN